MYVLNLLHHKMKGTHLNKVNEILGFPRTALQIDIF
jgi:hypothetical protein